MKWLVRVARFFLGSVLGYRVKKFEPARYIYALTDMFGRAQDIEFPCLSESRVDEIRKSGSIDSAFEECHDSLKADLGEGFSHLDRDALRAVFATVVASRYAEYGVSNATDYGAIATSPTLNCGNTVILSGVLFGENHETLRPIGFDGGVVGNHAQLYYDSRTAAGRSINLILDPTTGLVAVTTFDDLFLGKAVPSEQIRSFSIKAKTIDFFRKKVFRAVAEGKFKPSDFMYLHTSVLEMRRKGSSDYYFSPGGIVARERLANQSIGAK